MAAALRGKCRLTKAVRLSLSRPGKPFSDLLRGPRHAHPRSTAGDATDATSHVGRSWSILLANLGATGRRRRCERSGCVQLRPDSACEPMDLLDAVNKYTPEGRLPCQPPFPSNRPHRRLPKRYSRADRMQPGGPPFRSHSNAGTRALSASFDSPVPEVVLPSSCMKHTAHERGGAGHQSPAHAVGGRCGR